MDFSTLLRKRRSHRHYLKTPVPRESLIKMVRAAQVAPVSCNLQLTQYVIVDDPEVLRSLTSSASYKFSYSPSIVLVLHDERFTRVRSSGIMSAGMAVENMLLKAEELGLGTCPMAGFDGDRAVRKILGIPKHLSLLLIISVGFPDLGPQRISSVPRLPTDKVFSFNTYGPLSSLNDSPRLRNHSVSDIVDYRARIAPVYLDRFRLNSIGNAYYADAFLAFREMVGSRATRGGTLVDLLSYDGVFLKALIENRVGEIYSIIHSDYLEVVRTFFTDFFGTRGEAVSEKNSLDSVPSDSVDVATLVFKAEFTPALGALLEDSERFLKSGGILFVALYSESWHRRLFRQIKTLIRVHLLKGKVNLYEGNPFYKAGPFKNISVRGLSSTLNRLGLYEDGRKIFRYRKKGVRVTALTFVKGK